METTLTGQSFLSHVHELRRRLAWSALVVICGGLIGFLLRRSLVRFLVRPLHQQLFYSAPSGGFEFVMRISVSVGLVLALPVLIYNIIRFIEPAFEKHKNSLSRKKVLLIIGASVILAASGIAFAFIWVLPMSFHFFSEFNIGPIRPLISTSEYLGFVLGSLVTFALIFQLPLLLLSINSISRFPPGSLTKYRRHVIVGSLAIALVLPFTYDPITQFIVAIPIVCLYELSVVAIWANNRSHYRQLRETKRTQMTQLASKLAAPVSVVQPVEPRTQLAKPILLGQAYSVDKRKLIQL